jgi:hypothetical protein
VLAPTVLNRRVRKTPINQIGVVCTNITVSPTKTKKSKQQTKRFSFEPHLAGASSGSFETHAPRCHPKSSTCRGSNSARLSFIRSATWIALALISALNVFAAANFQQLPYTDPFPPAATPGNTNYCQPSSSVILNVNTVGVALPFTRALPTDWQSGLGAITIEFWMKQKPWTGPNNQSTDNPDGMILHGPGFVAEANFQWGTAGTHGAIIFTFSQVKGGAFVAKRPIVIMLEQSDQQWHHYAATYDLRTVRTYRDGELIDEKWLDNNTDRIGPIEDDPGNIFANALEVGTATGIPGGRAFQRGFLDSVRVSNVALSPWQVRRNFENARIYTMTLYVAAGAADSGLGTQASPTSLRTALSQVGANTKIILQAGTYSGSDFQVTRAALGKRDHCLITGADGSAPAIISGGTPTLSGASYVYLRNITFSSDAGTALSVNNATGVVVDSCRLSGTQKGLVASGSSKISIQNCIVNVSNIGLQLANSANSIVRNNTVVNGTVGIQFDSGSSSASVLNNLMSGQGSASLIVNNGAQQWYRGNGNLYNPASGTAAIVNGASYSTAQVRDKSFAQAWYNFDKADASDNNWRRIGYAAESQSMAFAPVFVDAANGDFRLLSTLGNALDAGAEHTFQRTIISPAYDSLGTPRPQGNGYDVGAFEGMGAAYALFVLNQDFTTSAGVYKSDGTLVKTLFSARRMFAGTNVVFWNGLDDNNQIAPASTYTIKMIAHNVQYVWENVVGNSSVPNCGESVHNGFEPIKAMTFNGTTAFYTSGYNENHLELNRFDTSNPNKLTKIFGPKTLITTDSITDVAADGSNLYAMNSATVSVYSQSGLNVIRTVGTGGGNSHVEAQRNGNLLFVSKKSQNTITIYDKNTGSQTGSISVSQPDDLSVTASGDLWVISGTSAIRYSVNAGGGTVAQTISGFGNPIAIACSPVDGTVLVADASTWQVKAFNSGGSLIWTHGQAGGFANGPRVTSDKFYWVFQDQNKWFTTTFLQFQPDGTWWVGDTFLSRSLHFNMNRQLLHEIDYQPHTYLGSVDVNNGSRVFNRFTEYNVDYSKPPQQAWTITNFWGYGLQTDCFGMEDGICSPITMNNGRTYALSYSTGSPNNGWRRRVVELTANGLRLTLSPDVGSYGRITKDGSLYGQTGNGTQTYWRKSFAGFDGNGDPQWNGQETLATANVGNGFLTSDPASDRFPLLTTSDIVVVYDSSRRTENTVLPHPGGSGFHLGGVKRGSNTWLWKAMPTFGPMDGKGGCDSWVEYGGNYHMVSGRNIFAGFHGEFFQDAGQAGQFMHYYDNGLFVGQFGQPLLFGVVVNPSGGSGNNFNPALVEVGADLFLYHNDEPGRGSHRWKTVGASDIRELSSSITIGLPPMTNNPPPGTNTNTVALPTVTVNATLPSAAEGGATGLFTISRDSIAASSLTVNFTVAGGATAGSDYQSLGTSATIPAGALFTNVTITAIDDATVESTETVGLTLNASANYTVGSPASATVSIIDNDAAAGLPDVVVLGVSATPANPAPGQQVLFTATIKNQGATATPATTIVGVGFYVNGGTVTSWVTKPQLQPGETATLTANDGMAGPYWNATTGNNTVVAVVDDVNRFSETIENNNSMTLALPVGVTNTPPPTVSLRPNGSQLVISWNSVVGKTYQVCYKTAMTNATWMPLVPQVTATGSNTSYTHTPPAGSPQRFYNVRVF